VGWKDDLKELRDALLAHNLKENVKAATEYLDGIEKNGASSNIVVKQTPPRPAKWTSVYLPDLTGFPKEMVFAQTLLGFEAASADTERISAEFRNAEDGYISCGITRCRCAW